MYAVTLTRLNVNSIMISILNNVAGKCRNMLFCEWLTCMIITDYNFSDKVLKCTIVSSKWRSFSKLLHANISNIE